jgi:CMP-N-acetylneuraminic acid synthetase
MYMFTKESFSKTAARIGAKPIMFETTKLESVDIDEPQDWQLAAALAPNFI